MRVPRKILALALIVTALAAESAHARFVLLEATYDNRTPGSSLQRRGAAFGEPVVGPQDNAPDVVVEDAPGDMSVRISDTTAALSQSDGDLLYFAFNELRTVSDGKLYLSCEFLPESFDTYSLAVTPPDYVGSFFTVTLDGAGLVYRLDGDTNNELMVGLNYVAGVPLTFELEFDLDAGTYDFTFNGFLALSDEPHGRLGEAVGAMVVGNQPDGNATGSVRIDNPRVSWAPGTATELLVAKFNDKPLGQPIQTRGAEFGEPTSVTTGVTAIVRGTVTPTPSLEIADDGIDEDDDGQVVFETLGNVTIDTGSVSVAMTLLLDSIESWEILFPDLGLEVHTASGNFVLYDVSGSVDVELGRHPLSTGFGYKLEFAFEFGFGRFAWWVADERVGPLLDLPDGVAGLRTVQFRLNQDSDLLGRMRVDNLEVYHSATATAAPALGPGVVARIVGVAPNPFNPSTEIHFELTSAGPVEVTIYDGRGRFVRRLVRAPFAAGMHRVVWNGLDATGRAVASGVYRAQLSTSQGHDRASLVLVK